MVAHLKAAGSRSSGFGAYPAKTRGRGLFLAAALAALALSGCNTAGQSNPVGSMEPGPSVASAASPASAASAEAVVAAPQVPATNCGRAIDEFAGLLSRDLENGMVARSVHDAAMTDLEVAASACRAGSQDQALSALRATRIRHGYPAG